MTGLDSQLAQHGYAFRALTREDVKIAVAPLPEDENFFSYLEDINEGHWTHGQMQLYASRMAEETEDRDGWGWCCVRVTARWYDYEASAYLGCVIAGNPQDFFETYADVYQDLVDDALHDLNGQVRQLVVCLAERIERIGVPLENPR